MTALGWDEWDRKLARSIFGSAEERAVTSMVEAWVEGATGAAARIISCTISVGAVIGLDLADGRKAALNVWPGDHDQRQRAAQVRIQASMAASGYPAPKVLAGLSLLGSGQAMLMAYDISGEATDVRRPGVRNAMARGFAEFISRAAAFSGETQLPDWRLQPGAPLWGYSYTRRIRCARPVLLRWRLARGGYPCQRQRDAPGGVGTPLI